MTREEISALKRMASKAFAQQPCDDCISRQALKRKLQEHHDLFINAYGGRVGFKSMADAKEKARVDEINNCIAMIVNEPPVTPKEKTGKWIDSKDWKEKHYDSMNFRKHCSLCNGIGKIQDKFCPNCGCHMVELQESEG